MKRKKDSIFSTRASQRCNKAKGKVDYETECHQLCPYFANIPSHITTHILLQLPIKSLLVSRCVCKIWKTLISEPHFAKLHFQRSPSSLMIRTQDWKRVSTLYLLESEPEKFEIGSNNHVKLAPIFKLPLRAVRLLSEKNNNNSQMLNIDFLPYDDKFGVVNSCNGLLCLCSAFTFEGYPLVICNPVTGEFIRLPKATNNHKQKPVHVGFGFGFGFQPKTNEYKVIQIWKKFVRHAKLWVLERVIFDINTLGTPSWRNVEVDPDQVSNSTLEYHTYLNGVIHWIRFEGRNRSRSILCFCLDSERLQSFPSPHVFRNHHRISRNERIRMGESRGLLYICDASYFHDVTMWVMKDYGIGESWTKVYSIDTSISFLGRPWQRYGVLCWPLKHFEDGASMLLYHSRNCLIYYEPEKYGFKVFRIHGTDSEFGEIFPHTPSLISLKDAVKGDSIEVLNIYSMCANVKLREENEVLSLSQQLDVI